MAELIWWVLQALALVLAGIYIGLRIGDPDD